MSQPTDNLQNASYDTVIDIIRNAGRPVTLIFGELPEDLRGLRVVASAVEEDPPLGDMANSNAAIEWWMGARNSILDEAPLN